MKPIFKRLVRFKDVNNIILYGEAPASVNNLVGQKVSVYRGDTPWALETTDQTAEIVEVLCPLADTPIIYGVGLNYKEHISEGSEIHGHKQATKHQHPTIFTKPPDALNGPFSPVYINRTCTDSMDYEGELVAVIGRDCKDITTPKEAIDVILGLAVGNDVTCRKWQHPEISGGQHGYAKSFDGFAPIGPVLVALSVLPINPSSGVVDLELVLKVNEEERQRGRTSDMVFNLADIIAHLSRGTTLRRGTVIMTGTPKGVALWMKPPGWIKDGDEVEVSIEMLGSIRNKHIF